MPDNIIHTTIKYESNCHYNESANYEEVEAPLNDTTITINNANWHCGEVVTITAHIRDKKANEVRWGNVTFYYVNETDYLQTEQKININPIPVNINGEASIKYMPYNDGKIIARYNGAPYYKDSEYILNFILMPQGTITEFSKYSPLLVDEKETVLLEVDVTNDYKKNNTSPIPIDYGVVTFLNYHAYDMDNLESGNEKVIGNPAYVSEGKAKIRYSPIQLDDSDELLGNIELIRAVYNYDNNLYGEKWHYYAMSEDYISIAIKRDNQVNMLVPLIADGNNAPYPMTCDEEGMFVANETNTLTCSCNIQAAGQEINNAEVFFYIDGTRYKHNNDEIEKVDYINSFKAEYNTNNKKFIAEISNIPEGFYQVYAKASNVKTVIGQDDNGEDVWYYLPSKNTTTEDMPTTEKGFTIPDGLYLKDTQSESFFIKINPLSNNLEVSLNLNSQIVTETTIENNNTYNVLKKENVTATIHGENITENDLTVLNERKCYFYIPALSIKQSGTIIRSGNKLQAHPDKDIKINVPGDYQLYAFIQGDTYQSNNISIKYETTYSQPLTLKIRRGMDITLDLQTPIKPAVDQIASDQYPGNIKYVVRAKNIGSDVLNVAIKIDNNQIAQHFLSTTSLSSVGQIPANALTVANKPHIITAEVQNPEYAGKIAQQSFNITKGDLQISLNNNSLNTYTGDQTDIILGVQHSLGYKIGTLNANKFEVLLTDYTDVIDISDTATIRTIKTSENENEQDNLDKSVNEYYYPLICTASIYDEGTWGIKVNYKGDSNYNATNNQDFINFKAINFEPNIVNISFNKIAMTNQVMYKTENETTTTETNGQTITTESVKYYGIDQYILVENTLINDDDENAEQIKILAITNINGEYQIPPQTASEMEWSQYGTVQYKINPKHEILNDFKNIYEDQSIINKQEAAVTAFKNKFNGNIDVSNVNDLDIKSLYAQAAKYNFKVLFLGYEAKDDGEFGAIYEGD